MTLLEAIDARHSVRAYKTDPIPEEIREKLDAFVTECNQDGDLHRAGISALRELPSVRAKKHAHI